MLFKGHTVIISDSLQDEHVLDISKRITSGEELMDFGIKGLGLPDFKIKTAMYDHSDSIQAATHELLSTWLKKQTDRQEAYKNLQAGLKRAQMNLDELFSYSSGSLREEPSRCVVSFLCQSKWSPMGRRAPAQGSSLDRHD